MEVRVVNDEYIVLKDMLEVLGRVKKAGGWNNELSRVKSLLEDIDKLSDLQELGVSSKIRKKESKEMQVAQCLKIETVPIVLAQFKPIHSNKRTELENQKALNTWKCFMKFVDELRKYQNQTTIDLLEVRKFVLKWFVNAYILLESHKRAGEMTLDLAMKKYQLNIVAA